MKAIPPRGAPSEPPELAELSIEKVGTQGDGVAAGPVYVPLTLPRERVLARRRGDRAELIDFLQASPERVVPPCPHFGACGGCALQHWSHAPYLAWKIDQIRTALARERIETEFAAAFAAKPGSRRRVSLHARLRGDRVALGYKARRSWSLVEISTCPIAEPRIVEALPALRHFARAFFEHPKSAPTLHVTATETGLDIDVTGVEAKSGGLSADARVRAAEAAASADFARASLAGEIIYQSRAPVVRFGRACVELPPGGFLQAVAEAEQAMAEFALDVLQGRSRIADLFCGAGAFSFRLAETAAVAAYDGSEAAIAALRRAAGATSGLKPIRAEARDLVRRPIGSAELDRLDAVLFDPPRAGALEQARQIAASKLDLAVAVSCNPATFARDARVLCDAGFTLARALPVDQFLWSPHIELVGVFRR